MKKKLTFDFFGSATELITFVNKNKNKNKNKIEIESITYENNDDRYVLFYWVKE